MSPLTISQYSWKKAMENPSRLRALSAAMEKTVGMISSEKIFPACVLLPRKGFACPTIELSSRGMILGVQLFVERYHLVFYPLQVITLIH